MKNLNVRLSDELHARLKAAAAADARSLNSEIVVLLEAVLEARGLVPDARVRLTEMVPLSAIKEGTDKEQS